MNTTELAIPVAPPQRGVFVNRTLNLRSIRAIGYDMDYTLVHYRVDEWERRTFAHARDRLRDLGWPVAGLEFDPASVIRGLVIDLESGNLVKATRFGYIIRAAHGTRGLDYNELRRAYEGVIVRLSEDRWRFMNTLFSLSEASLYTQLVDLLETGSLPGGIGYGELYQAVRAAIDASHHDGLLKSEIVADPERFIDLDPDIVLALRDQRMAGKRLMLVTNSDWNYANEVMTYAFDRFLPEGESWRGLFDTVIVSANKPEFFTSSNPLYKVVDEERSLLQPHHGPIEQGGAFFGGNARLVEQSLEVSGDEILYVGDHVFGDVHFSTAVLRWRTSLILRELESEVGALIDFLPGQERLTELMDRKARLESELSALRLAAQRVRLGYADSPIDVADVPQQLTRVRKDLGALDDQIAPYAIEAGRLRNETWGPLMRAGADKSLFARQVEGYADIYTSRVSNLLYPGPFAIFRTGRLDLPHDPQPPHAAR